MNTKLNGGSAFPLTPGGCSTPNDGLTKRDYFAAAALTGLASKYEIRTTQDYNHAADIAYGFADAMLKAREA